MQIRLMRKADQALILSSGDVANHFWKRLRGLIGLKALDSGKGLLFPKCNSVHMWMMSIPIDVIFLKNNIPHQEWEVVGLREHLKPWKLMPVTCLKADDTLELSAGMIARHRIKLGEVLCTVS